MRVFLASLMVLTSACFGPRSGSDGATELTVGRTPAEVLQIATTQLTHHAFKVTKGGDNAVVTQPRPIPAHLQDTSGAGKGKLWMVHVTAARATFTGGSRVRVLGYIVPTQGGQQRATPITTRNAKLYREVVTITGWIVDEAKRKKTKS